MIYGIGVDISDIDRIGDLWKNYGDLFVKKILSEQEILNFDKLISPSRKIEYLSGRFSSKESFVKAFGTGFGVITFQDISVLNHSSGKPFIYQSPFIGKSHISISHTNKLVFTEVILEKDNGV